MKVQRYRALDGVRGIGAFTVLLYHMKWNSIFTLNPIVGNGFIAVDIFFILSGFVIAHAYINDISERNDLLRFMSLRIFRIYPLHLFLLVIFVLMEFLKYAPTAKSAPFSGEASIQMLFATAALVQAWGYFGHNSWNSPSWSISCEMFAYIIFAFVTLTGVVRARYFVPFVAFFAALSYLFVAIYKNGLADAIYQVSLVRGLGGFSIGTCIYLISNRYNRETIVVLRSTAIATALECIALFILVVLLWWVQGWQIIYVLPVLAILIFLFSQEAGAVSRLLCGSLFQLLGELSYSIYLGQALILYIGSIFLKRVLPAEVIINPVNRTEWYNYDTLTGSMLSLVFIIIVLGVSYLTFNYIEKPGRLFGRRLVAKLQTVPE